MRTTIGKLRQLIKEAMGRCPKCGGPTTNFGFSGAWECDKCQATGDVTMNSNVFDEWSTTGVEYLSTEEFKAKYHDKFVEFEEFLRREKHPGLGYYEFRFEVEDECNALGIGTLDGHEEEDELLAVIHSPDGDVGSISSGVWRKPTTDEQTSWTKSSF